MAKQTASVGKIKKPKKRRRGVHAKKKSSNSKNAKLYAKKYVGQG